MKYLVDQYKINGFNKDKSYLKNKFSVGTSRFILSDYVISDKYVIYSYDKVCIFNSKFELLDESTFPDGSGYVIVGLFNDNLYLNNVNQLGITYLFNIVSKDFVKLNHYYKGALFLNEGIVVSSLGKLQFFSYDDKLIWEYRYEDEMTIAGNIRYECGILYYTRNAKYRYAQDVKSGNIIYELNIDDLLNVSPNEISGAISYLIDGVHIGIQICANTNNSTDLFAGQHHNAGYNRFFGIDTKTKKIKWDTTVPYFYAHDIYDKCYFNIYVDMITKRIMYLVMDLINGKILIQIDIDDQIRAMQFMHETDKFFRENNNLTAVCVSEEYFYFGCGSLYFAMNRNDYSLTLIRKQEKPIGYGHGRIFKNFLLIDTLVLSGI